MTAFDQAWSVVKENDTTRFPIPKEIPVMWMGKDTGFRATFDPDLTNLSNNNEPITEDEGFPIYTFIDNRGIKVSYAPDSFSPFEGDLFCEGCGSDWNPLGAGITYNWNTPLPSNYQCGNCDKPATIRGES
tara:strand:- start:76 stop:468 length:393 start_codon:yes stop_codon:yes gene_type:complete